jgi:hypothetical protein
MMPTREPATRSADEVKEPANGPTERLSSDEVKDEADTSPRAAEPKLEGKRLRGIPAVITNAGDRSTTIEIRPQDLVLAGGPEIQRKLVFDARIDRSTLQVGSEDGQVTEEVADFLSKTYPTSFEYLDEG